MKHRRRLIVWFGRVHVWVYDRSGGRVWARLRGKPMALVWTTGRKSGLRRQTALLCMPHDEDVIVVGSFYGAEQHPAWYLNLLATPECEVRVGRSKYPAIARTAEGEHRSDLWERLVGHWPAYDDYQSRTERPIPVVVLSRATNHE